MASESVSSTSCNPSELPSKQINTCEKGHHYKFFCAPCDSLFCGGWWVRKHVGEFSSHKHFELHEALSRNTKEIAQTLEVLKDLNASMEMLIESKNR